MSRQVPALVPGDWNLPRETVAELARRVSGQLVQGRGVDHVLLAGDDVRLRRVRRDLPAHGSDHDPLLVDLDLAGELVRLLWWNVYVGQPPERVAQALTEFLALSSPHVVALAEAYRCRPELAKLARRAGYRLVQSRRRGEPCNLAVLVRDDLRILRRGRAKMRTAWIGPVHGLRKSPREFPRLVLRTPGGVRFRLLAVHLPTGGTEGRNAEAVREAVERIARWAER